MNSDADFDKLLYKYLIKSEGISGAQICAMVYEQGVLPMDEAAYNGLNNRSVNPYTWLCQKIEIWRLLRDSWLWSLVRDPR